MPFEPITTQEALDALLQTERKRAEQRFNGWLSPEAVQQQYQGYTSPEDLAALNTQHQTELQTRDTRIAELEAQNLRHRVARETGLPQELADRLTGADEAAMRTDAQTMLDVIGKHRGGTPSAQAETTPDAEIAAYRSMAADL